MLGKWKLLFSSPLFSAKHSEFLACTNCFYRILETIIIFLYGFAVVEWLQCFIGNNIKASSLHSAADTPCSFNCGPLSSTQLKPSVTLLHTAFSASCSSCQCLEIYLNWTLSWTLGFHLLIHALTSDMCCNGFFSAWSWRVSEMYWSFLAQIILSCVFS